MSVVARTNRSGRRGDAVLPDDIEDVEDEEDEEDEELRLRPSSP